MKLIITYENKYGIETDTIETTKDRYASTLCMQIHSHEHLNHRVKGVKIIW